jgi:hypothetical protein
MATMGNLHVLGVKRFVKDWDVFAANVVVHEFPQIIGDFFNQVLCHDSSPFNDAGISGQD